MTKEEKKNIETFIEKCKKYDGGVEIKGVTVGEESRILDTVCKALNLIEKLQKENEEVKDILDEKEKEYLSNIIKPFKNKVISITKFEFNRDRLKEFIAISIENDYAINLPNFKKNTMYQNMELDKMYTLEELGL